MKEEATVLIILGTIIVATQNLVLAIGISLLFLGHVLYE